MSKKGPEKPQKKARPKFGVLVPPNPLGLKDIQVREKWLSSVTSGFVAPSSTNKQYYRALLEALWPSGHAIPGPQLKMEQLREAIDHYRMKSHKPEDGPYKPYIDVFRRMRELQGEEGLIGVAKQGNVYQLVDLNLGPKRSPRVKLSDSDWRIVQEKYENRCAVCGRREPDVKFDQDHKVPRLKGGGDAIDNWQPLCGECNNFKSVSCRACDLDCGVCGWAFPEKYAPLKLKPETILAVRALAEESGVSEDDLIKRLVDALRQ